MPGPQKGLSKVKTSSGLLRICCYCKKIRGDDGYWQQVEAHIDDHSAAQFTHGICPECYKKAMAKLAKEKRTIQKERRGLTNIPRNFRSTT